MSTHLWHCAWCGVQTGCCADEHALESGQRCECTEPWQYHEGPSDHESGPPRPVCFCSIKCFTALKENMNKMEASAREYHPEWFGGKPRDDLW